VQQDPAIRADDTRIAEHFRSHLGVTARVRDELSEEIARAAGILVRTFRRGGRALLFGNGGSMADAIHIEGELSGRFRFDRDPLPAIALATGASSLTAIANDLGFDEVFARPVRALGRKGDAALAISTSGRSANVLAGARAAREAGLELIALAGRDGGPLAELADCALVVPCDDTAVIQEHHILIAHILCRIVEEELFGPGGIRGSSGSTSGRAT